VVVSITPTALAYTRSNAYANELAPKRDRVPLLLQDAARGGGCQTDESLLQEKDAHRATAVRVGALTRGVRLSKEPRTDVDPELETDANAYFQAASDWSQRSRRLDTLLHVD
jgi:hypothetical protein